MEYRIRQSKLFEKKVTDLLAYLEQSWNKKVAQDFKQILDRKMLQLIKEPDSGRNSQKIAGVQWILITKHNKLFYRIKDDTIYMITLFDTRQNPKKNKYE